MGAYRLLRRLWLRTPVVAMVTTSLVASYTGSRNGRLSSIFVMVLDLVVVLLEM